jgi:1-acyl-sn-glycerol-3-phosphate acyltransferase
MSGGLLANAIAAGARALAGPSVRWVRCAPGPGQRVYFANHTSHLDFVVLWSVLPPEFRTLTRPVAAKDYWSSGLRKAIAVNAFHSVLVERGAKTGEADRVMAARNTLGVLLDALGTENSLIVFPEGTRGTGFEVAPFKSGIYYLWLKRQDVQFVPVYLANLNRILPKGEFLPVPVISRVAFGAPLQLNAGETKESFLGKAHAAVCALREA